MYQQHVYHADFYELRLPCDAQLGPGESLTGHRPEVNCAVCRAILAARGYMRPGQFYGEAVSPRPAHRNVATPEQIAFGIERVRFGSLGDLKRLREVYHLLPGALAATSTAGLLSVERKAELWTQLCWSPVTEASSWLLAVLPAVAEVEETGQTTKTTIHSDHPLPTGKSVKVDKGGETVTFTYN